MMFDNFLEILTSSPLPIPNSRNSLPMVRNCPTPSPLTTDIICECPLVSIQSGQAHYYGCVHQAGRLGGVLPFAPTSVKFNY